MTLWRISNHAKLEGRCGLITSARWHTIGRPVVYLASSPSSALLEILIHLELTEALLPDSYQLLKVQAPDEIATENVALSALPRAWEEDLAATRRIGDGWLGSRRTALLEIPSAIVPETLHYLLNPAHPEASNITIEWARRFPHDKRLLRGTR